MGQNISDVFYPDNPNRRARAYQLKSDIEAFCFEFNEVKASRDRLLNEVKPKLAEFLKSLGYNSPDELDQKVRSTLTGSQLAEYNSYKERYDKTSDIETIMFQISSIVSLSSGVFVGALLLLGAITGGTALALIGAIGAALGVIVIIAVLFAAFEGAQERVNLREAIRKLGFERVKVRKALEMKAIADWIRNIIDWLDDPIYMEYPDLLKKKLEGDFYSDFAKAEDRPVIEWLKQFDRDRGAWTYEDGDWERQNYSSVQFIIDSELPKPGVVVVRQRDHAPESRLELAVINVSQKECIMLDKWGVKWSLIYSSVEVKGNPDLAESNWNTYRFALENLQSREILDGFRILAISNIG